MSWRGVQLAQRFLKYNVVGALGLTLRLTSTMLLHELAGIGYLLATSLAVEITMLHNYSWHLRWTWRDRCAQIGPREIARSLVRFQLTNGAVAMIVNLLLMPTLVRDVGMGYLPASVLVITITGILNFLLANFLVFEMAAPPGWRGRSD